MLGEYKKSFWNPQKKHRIQKYLPIRQRIRRILSEKGVFNWAPLPIKILFQSLKSVFKQIEVN